MKFNKIVGEVKIEKTADGYFVHDDECFICGTLGINKEKFEDMVKRANEYEALNLIGKKIYYIESYGTCDGVIRNIIPETVGKIEIDETGAYIYINKNFNIPFESLNKSWFLTEEAARNMIKKLEEKLTNDKKLMLINSMEVIEFSASGEEMEYILVADTKENREILYKTGMTDSDIEDECFPSDDCLDLIVVGFKYADTWFKDKGFANE